MFVIAALTVITLPRRGAADPRAEAKQHVDHATELHGRGQFAQALDELKTAFSLDPRPELLYAMGQLHVRLGQCPQAITYYRRYLTTKPGPSTSNAAIEAIEVCKRNPPPVAVDASASNARKSMLLLGNPEVTSTRAWYGDRLADALVVGGVVAGLVGVFEYRAALQDRDRADTAIDFGGYVELVDRAHSQRASSLVFGAAGAALIAAGGLHYVLTDRRAGHAVAIAPSRGGGIVTWTGSFP